MSTTPRCKYPLNLPISLKETAARLAKDDGVSLNQWIATAVAQKIGAVETAEVFLAERAARATPGDLQRYLDVAPNTPPIPVDEMPETWLTGRVMPGNDTWSRMDRASHAGPAAGPTAAAQNTIATISGEGRHRYAILRWPWGRQARGESPSAGYTQPVGFGSPAYLHACLAGP